MINFDEVIHRLKIHAGLSTDLQLSELFKLSPPDFSRRKKRGTLLPLIIEWGIDQNVNMHWLLTGKGEPDLREWDDPVKEIEALDDYQLLQEIIEWLEEFLESDESELPPHKKARFIVFAYKYFKDTKKEPDKKTMVGYLRLVS